MNNSKKLFFIILAVGIATVCTFATKRLLAASDDAQSMLFNAAIERDVDLLQSALKEPGIDVNALDYHRFSALMLTIIPHDTRHSRDTRCLDILLAHPDININLERPSSDGRGRVTALTLAVNWDHSKAIQALLKHRNSKGELDLNLNQANGTGDSEDKTALMQAARLGHKASVICLLADERLDLRSNDQGLRAIAEVDAFIDDEAAYHLYRNVGIGFEIQKLIKECMQKQGISVEAADAIFAQEHPAFVEPMAFWREVTATIPSDPERTEATLKALGKFCDTHKIDNEIVQATASNVAA